MTSYEVIENSEGVQVIKRITNDGIVAFIPTDPANSDYQAYLNKDNPDWNNQPTL